MTKSAIDVTSLQTLLENPVKAFDNTVGLETVYGGLAL